MILIVAGALSLASCEAGAELIPGRLLDDSLTLPLPELTLPDPRLVAPWLESLRQLRVDVSESGLVSVASAGETGGFEPLFELERVGAAGLSLPYGVPPFASSLELAPSGLRASIDHDRNTTFGASGYALLPWQVWLVGHSWLSLDLDGDRVRFEPGLELSPRIVWGGLSLETAGLRSGWVEEEGLQVCSPADSIRIGYAVAGARSALGISGKLGVEITDLEFERPDWRGELSLGLAPQTGSCMIRPQATIIVLEHEQQFQGSLRLGVTSDLIAGQSLDLLLEYPRLEMLALSLNSLVLPEQRLVLRLVF